MSVWEAVTYEERLDELPDWLLKYVGPLLPEFDQVSVTRTKWHSGVSDNWYTDWKFAEGAETAWKLGEPVQGILTVTVRLMTVEENGTYWDAGGTVRIGAKVEGTNGMMFNGNAGLRTHEQFYVKDYAPILKRLDMDRTGWVE